MDTHAASTDAALRQLKAQHTQELDGLKASHTLALQAARDRDKADYFRQLSDLKAGHAMALHSIRMHAAKLVEEHDA